MERLIVYDGDCNLCNTWRDFVIDKSEPERFAFIPFQEAESLLEKYPEIPRDMSSVAYIEKERVFLYSTASLEIMKQLNYPYCFLYAFKIVPWFIRDPVYRFVGNRRYKWFGKRQG